MGTIGSAATLLVVAAAVAPPPDRAPSSCFVISAACGVGLRLGASAERSALPGMRPARSVAFTSALAEVSSQDMSCEAAACVAERQEGGGESQLSREGRESSLTTSKPD